MNILGLAQNVAVSVGLSAMENLVASTDEEHVEILQFITDTCIELTRRADWGDLTKSVILTGDGTALTHDLPDDFDRLTGGVSVASQYGVVRPLSQGEWAALNMIEGDPRYFLLRDDSIQFYPYLADGLAASVSYQSSSFVVGSTNVFDADDQETIFDDRLVISGAIVRWRRQKGLPFEDYANEYEAILKQRAGFDDRNP